MKKPIWILITYKAKTEWFEFDLDGYTCFIEAYMDCIAAINEKYPNEYSVNTTTYAKYELDDLASKIKGYVKT